MEKQNEEVSATQEDQSPRTLHYSAVLAEVVHVGEDGKERINKVQFFTQSDVEVFPLRRLQQLQNAAAVHLIDNVGQDKVGKVTGVWILNIIKLGWMTSEQFNGAGITVENTDPDAPR